MDIGDTIAPKSDQLNAEDLLSGALTVTVTEVRVVGGDQPVHVFLAEFPGRPFKPSKTIRRVLVAAWGKESSAYTGRRMTIYRDPSVKFGGEEVGGIRISHMSHIDKRFSVALTVTKGKRAPYIVEPLVEATPLTAEQIATADREQITRWWNEYPGQRPAMTVRVEEIKAAEAAPDA